MENYDQVKEYLHQKMEVVLESVEANKERLFAELIDSGLSKCEIEEIIDNWQLKNEFPNGEIKKRGLLSIQGIAASLHVFEKLSYAQTQKSEKAYFVFKDLLADLGVILVMLAEVAIYRNGKIARMKFVGNLQKLFEEISESEKRVKQQMIDKASSKKKKKVEKNIKR